MIVTTNSNFRKISIATSNDFTTRKNSLDADQIDLMDGSLFLLSDEENYNNNKWIIQQNVNENTESYCIDTSHHDIFSYSFDDDTNCQSESYVDDSDEMKDETDYFLKLKGLIPSGNKSDYYFEYAPNCDDDQTIEMKTDAMIPTISSKKSVRFGNVSIREYSVTVGAYSSVKDSCPIQLSWEYSPEFYVSCDEYKTSIPRRHRLSLNQHRERIATVQGVSIDTVINQSYEIYAHNRLNEYIKYPEDDDIDER